jgi:light-regulated signal transduction histidine kinase (bacteriophytochrome)
VGEAMAISFSDMFKAFDVEQQREYLSSFGDVNWASAIDGAAALKEMLQSTNEAVQEFAAKTILLEDTTYSATAQMNEFYKSLSAEALDELAEDGKSISFIVTDTGSGIPEAIQNKIFDAFEKQDSFVQGMGLGLTICKLIAQSLNGSIHLDTEYKNGTKMIFNHPII